MTERPLPRFAAQMADARRLPSGVASREGRDIPQIPGRSSMSRCTRCSVVHLADVPEAVPILSGWLRHASRPYHGATGQGEPEADLKACVRRGSLPAGFVALDADRVPVGTASVKRTSPGSDDCPGPWLVALLVTERCRGRGIGTDLVSAVQAEATRLGFPALYASMPPSSTLLRRCGWIALGSTASLRGTMTVFGKYLI